MNSVEVKQRQRPSIPLRDFAEAHESLVEQADPDEQEPKPFWRVFALIKMSAGSIGTGPEAFAARFLVGGQTPAQEVIAASRHI